AFEIWKTPHEKKRVGIIHRKKRPQYLHADGLMCRDTPGFEDLEKLGSLSWLDLVGAHFDAHRSLHSKFFHHEPCPVESATTASSGLKRGRSTIVGRRLRRLSRWISRRI